MILSAAQDQRSVLATTTPIQLGAISTSPRTARASAVAALREWGRADLADAAGAIISELVTNAVQASQRAATPIALRLVLTTASVIVEVLDYAPDVPTPRQPDGESESGRGLALVAALAADLGWNPTGTGKVVWAEIRP
jgi:anti-sigma regulatory factor (Ser/Thr protein kinase)